MRKDKNNKPINESILGDTPGVPPDEVLEELFDGEEMCPWVGDLMSFYGSFPKPFGLPWNNLEKIEKFLIARGYKIIERKRGRSGEDSYKIAVKPDDPQIPTQPFSNLRDVFAGEVEDIILEKLLGNGNN